jgi:hypothetical protein
MPGIRTRFEEMMNSIVRARSSQSQLAKSACKINPMPSIESSAARRFWPTRPLSYDKGGTSGERAIPEALRMRGARCYPPHIALHCTNPTRQIASQMMAYGVGGVPGPGDWSHFFCSRPLYPGGPYKFFIFFICLTSPPGNNARVLTWLTKSSFRNLAHEELSFRNSGSPMGNSFTST